MSKINVGDRVEVIKDDEPAKVGMRGTVVRAEDDRAGVEFDKFMGGHSCHGKAKANYGYFLEVRSLKVISEPKETYKDFKFGVCWLEDNDPIEFFSTREEAESFVHVLSERSGVEKDSVILFSVSDFQKVKFTPAFVSAE